MKILHLSKWERWPGGVIALNRLHQELVAKNVDSKILAINKISTDPNIEKAIIPRRSISEKVVSILRYYHDSGFAPISQNRYVHNFSPNLQSSGFLKLLNKYDYDAIHLHFVSDGTISIPEIGKIKKPVFWTLHNSWPFSGGCEIPYDCKRSEQQCGNCPMLAAQGNNDLSHKVWLAKSKYWSGSNMTFIAPSKSIAKNAIDSSLLRNKQIITIPHGLDLSIFRPHDKRKARKILGLPQDKEIILFGAHNCNLPHKGFGLLQEALETILLPRPRSVNLATFGSRDETDNKALSQFEQYHLGIIKSENRMSLLYSAVDIFVAPYLFDSFGQTLSESLACGTPVVCFDIGGPRDIVDHKVNGYLARPYSVKDLAVGITWTMENKKKLNLSVNAREKAINNFDIRQVAQRHIDLYNKIILSA